MFLNNKNNSSYLKVKYHSKKCTKKETGILPVSLCVLFKNYWHPLHLAQSQPHCKDLPCFLLFIMLHTTRATIPITIASTIAVPIIPFISMLLSQFLLYNSYCFAYLFFLNSRYTSATTQMIAAINPITFTLPANNRPN